MKHRSHSWHRLSCLVAITSVLAIVACTWNELDRRIQGIWHAPGAWWGKQATLHHYSAEVALWSDEFGLPTEYFLALIQLESGGRKPAGHRFEPHVFERLQSVRDGRLAHYENITQQDIAEASDEALKNMATSWGPFQLMGYKCVLLDVQIRDLRGEDAIQSGMTWINMTYGDLLRQGKFQDAFHLHNTGKPYPQQGPPTTFHPDYVERGMDYMRKFEHHASE
ncbi:MAG: hypothetical protein ACO3MV_00770 [Flavobacteriales bacterium]